MAASLQPLLPFPVPSVSVCSARHSRLVVTWRRGSVLEPAWEPDDFATRLPIRAVTPHAALKRASVVERTWPLTAMRWIRDEAIALNDPAPSPALAVVEVGRPALELGQEGAAIRVPARGRSGGRHHRFRSSSPRGAGLARSLVGRKLSEEGRTNAS